MEFCTSENESSSRVGKLKVNQKEILTPCPILYSAKGSIAGVPPDQILVIQKNQKILQVAIDNLIFQQKVLKSYEKSAASFLNLTDYVIFSTLSNPEYFFEGLSSEKSLTVPTEQGNRPISLPEFQQFQESIQADFYTTPYLTSICHNCSSKKNQKSVKLGESWLDSCIKYKKEKNLNSELIAPIQGGSNIDQRMRSIDLVLERDNDLAGYFLTGFGYGENQNERIDMLQKIITRLPQNKIRILQNVGAPNEVLEAVKLGIDFFNTTYPETITQQTKALIFEYKTENLKQESNKEKNKYFLDLADKKYERDSKPIFENCKCFTCLNHSRSYLHHLFNTKELLGTMLLSTYSFFQIYFGVLLTTKKPSHNIHHYLSFFEEIRSNIETQNLNQYQIEFNNTNQQE